MSETADRRIELRTVSNMRDLGGLPVDGGVVRPGQVFRSATLEHASEEDQAVLLDLGIEIVYDLRTGAEREGAPGRVPPAWPWWRSMFSPTARSPRSRRT